jgi:hypothetical protein
VFFLFGVIEAGGEMAAVAGAGGLLGDGRVLGVERGGGTFGGSTISKLVRGGAFL